MEFRQLEYFVTLTQCESFTKAAELLNVSQPSVTKGIKALEAELRLILIDRRIKHVTLTPQGKALLRHAKAILNSVREAKRDMRRFSEKVRPVLHFGVPPVIEAYLFPDFFTRFMMEEATATLDIEESNDSEEIRRRISSGDLDFGIVIGDVSPQKEGELVLIQDKMSLCLFRGHPLLKQDTVAVESLKNERFIMQKDYSYQYKSTVRACEAAGFTPKIAHTFTPIKTIKDFVTKREGISVLPNFAIVSDGGFITRPLAPELKFNISLVWNVNKELGEHDKQLIDFVKRYIMTEEFKSSFVSP